MVEICKTIGWFLCPLGIIGLLGTLFFVERLSFLNKTALSSRGFVDGIKGLLIKGRFMEALTLCEHTQGAVARLTKGALLNHQQPAMVLRLIVQQSALVELPLLRKRIESVRLLSAIAPMIGLIGTVFFLLKGFWMMGSVQAYTQLTTFSPYIVSACSVTFLGLIEMLLLAVGYYFLNSRARRIVFDLEWVANEWVVFFQQTPLCCDNPSEPLNPRTNVKES